MEIRIQETVLTLGVNERALLVGICKFCLQEAIMDEQQKRFTQSFIESIQNGIHD